MVKSSVPNPANLRDWRRPRVYGTLFFIRQDIINVIFFTFPF